jgi:hypothetical protein
MVRTVPIVCSSLMALLSIVTMIDWVVQTIARVIVQREQRARRLATSTTNNVLMVNGQPTVLLCSGKHQVTQRSQRSPRAGIAAQRGS